jgi:hypothetical protein
MTSSESGLTGSDLGRAGEVAGNQQGLPFVMEIGNSVGETEVEDMDYREQGRAKRKRELAAQSLSPSGSPTAKKQGIAAGVTVEPPSAGDLIVYMRGKTGNITQCRPDIVKKEINDQFQPTLKIEKAGTSLRIFCRSALQMKQLLENGLVVAGLEVVCTEPRGKRSVNPGAVGTVYRQNLVKLVAGGVPEAITEEEIRVAAGAREARRILKRREGVMVPTMAVALTYQTGDELPSRVAMDYLSFRLRPYVAQPLRCFTCQRFGHVSNTCRSKTITCPTCAGKHAYNACPNKNTPKCSNCGEGHSAAYRKCRAFEEVQQTLKVAATQKISYRDALVKVKLAPAAVEVGGGAVSAAGALAVLPVVHGNTSKASGDRHGSAAEQRSTVTKAASAEKTAQVEVTTINDATTASHSIGGSVASGAVNIAVSSQTARSSETEQGSIVMESMSSAPISVTGGNYISMEAFCRFLAKFVELTTSLPVGSTMGTAAVAAAIHTFGGMAANDMAAISQCMKP